MINISNAVRIPGWMTKRELKWLARMASQSRSIIEVGSWQGRSTRVLADHTRGRVCAVDPWGLPYLNEDGTVNEIDTDVYAKFTSNLGDHIDSERVLPIRKCFSEQSFPPASADFIFIDGDHRYETVCADIDKSLDILKPKGILAGHDYRHKDWPGVKRAVDERFGCKIKLVDSIWWLRL